MQYYGIFKRTDNGQLRMAWREGDFPNDSIALQLMKVLIVKTKEGNSSPYHIDRLMCGKRIVYNGG